MNKKLKKKTKKPNPNWSILFEFFWRKTRRTSSLVISFSVLNRIVKQRFCAWNLVPTPQQPSLLEMETYLENLRGPYTFPHTKSRKSFIQDPQTVASTKFSRIVSLWRTQIKTLVSRILDEEDTASPLTSSLVLSSRFRKCQWIMTPIKAVTLQNAVLMGTRCCDHF